MRPDVSLSPDDPPAKRRPPGTVGSGRHALFGDTTRSMNGEIMVLLAILFGTSVATAAPGGAAEATSESYAANPNSGVVLLDVNWGRRWNCGGFENAELRSLGFDRVPPLKTRDDEAPDLVLEQPPGLSARPTFTNYALLVEPGEYVLSVFEMKVARSVSDAHTWDAKRSELIKDGAPQGGKFKVEPGEAVYIGNFWLDCFRRPQPWRYYTETRQDFDMHIAQYKQKYPLLRLEDVKYRLFETTRLGRPYALP